MIPDDDTALRWTPWNRRPPTAQRARLPRIYCLPHAGGGGVHYLPWMRQQDPGGPEIVPIELPGRGFRLAEEPFDDMDELVAALVDQLFGPASARPFALFGHSMGAFVAYEVARRLVLRGDPPPIHLVLSGCRPPGATPARRFDDLSDDALVASITELGGTPAEVLRREDMMELIMPAMRADLTLLGRYYDTATPAPVPCPITVFGGDSDHLAEPPWLTRWRAVTTAGFAVRVFPGGHFYLRERSAEVLRALTTSVIDTATVSS